MKITEHQLIGALVASDYRAASVFQQYGIDFCCKGNRSIADACRESSVSPGLLITALQECIGSKEEAANHYESWPLDLLIDYIEKKHHRYVREKSPELLQYLDRICQVHGAHHPEFLDIHSLFQTITTELNVHMQKEEQVLFPYIRKMIAANETDTLAELTHSQPLHMMIGRMMAEHEAEGDRIQRIRELCHAYTPPSDTCGTVRLSFSLLDAFEKDLHLHIHLENNILFPKAIAMEKRAEANTL